MSKLEQIEEYYDTYATVYDTKHGVIHAGQEYNFRRYYAPFLNKWIAPDCHVLELGCGTGVYTKWLLESGCSVDAMDISVKMIDEAKRRAPSARYFIGNCETPRHTLAGNAPVSGYDVVLGINTLSYYVDKNNTFSEVSSLLKPGGRLVVIDMNGASLYYTLMRKLKINEMPQWFDEISESNPKQITSLIKKHGFTVDEITSFAFLPNGLSNVLTTSLKPFDKVLHSLPFMRTTAMRLAYVARKPG